MLCSQGDGYAGFGPKDAPALWLHLHKGGKATGAHVAFSAKDHDAVKKFHAAGLKAGGSDNGGAGPRKDYSPTYYAAFLIDPDGNNVEAAFAQRPPPPHHVIASEAKQSIVPHQSWIASSLRASQ